MAMAMKRRTSTAWYSSARESVNPCEIVARSNVGGGIANYASEGGHTDIIIKNSPRTYNQVNVPRKYTAGRRRFTIYWTWSYPWEANRDVTELDNRFSTMTEVRRVGWPR